jgi:hypothetical protein
MDIHEEGILVKEEEAAYLIEDSYCRYTDHCGKM